jgi:hypothetical protein
MTNAWVMTDHEQLARKTLETDSHYLDSMVQMAAALGRVLRIDEKEISRYPQMAMPEGRVPPAERRHPSATT